MNATSSKRTFLEEENWLKLDFSIPSTNKRGATRKLKDYIPASSLLSLYSIQKGKNGTVLEHSLTIYLLMSGWNNQTHKQDCKIYDCLIPSFLDTYASSYENNTWKQALPFERHCCSSTQGLYLHLVRSARMDSKGNNGIGLQLLYHTRLTVINLSYIGCNGTQPRTCFR